MKAIPYFNIAEKYFFRDTIPTHSEKPVEHFNIVNFYKNVEQFLRTEKTDLNF